MHRTLYQLPIGKSARIKEILTDHVTKERLESLGLIEGVEVSVVRPTPLGCPRIYRCLNTMIALRNNIAKEILVVDEDENEE